MTRKKAPIQLKKLAASSNPRLTEMLSEVGNEAVAETTRPSIKPAWGRRFNASGKFKVPAPKIRLSYNQ